MLNEKIKKFNRIMEELQNTVPDPKARMAAYITLMEVTLKDLGFGEGLKLEDALWSEVKLAKR